MNSRSTSWASYCRKWSSRLKFEEAGVGVFCGFIAINLPNIRFNVSGANALSRHYKLNNKQDKYFFFGEEDKIISKCVGIGVMCFLYLSIYLYI
jgi:F0F1-type ATP synthase assembly protein I